MSNDKDALAVFRAMLDRTRWPIKPGVDFMIIEGEVYVFRTDHPLEERVYKPLYR